MTEMSAIKLAIFEGSFRAKLPAREEWWEKRIEDYDWRVVRYFLVTMKPGDGVKVAITIFPCRSEDEANQEMGNIRHHSYNATSYSDWAHDSIIWLVSKEYCDPVTNKYVEKEMVEVFEPSIQSK